MAVAKHIAFGSLISLVLQASSNQTLNCPIGSLDTKFFSKNVSFLSLYFIRIPIIEIQYYNNYIKILICKNNKDIPPISILILQAVNQNISAQIEEFIFSILIINILI